MRGIAAICAGWLLLAACGDAFAHAAALELTCTGSVSLSEPEVGAVTTYGPNGPSSGAAFTGGSRSVPGDVQFVFEDGGGRIHIPPPMRPTLHSADAAGWRPLSDVRVLPDFITAKFRLNFANKPRAGIDRRTGVIAINGFAGTHFQGLCEKLDPSRAKKF